MSQRPRTSGAPGEHRSSRHLVDASVASIEPPRGFGPWLRAHLRTWWPVWLAFAASRIGVFAVGFLSQYAGTSRDLTVLPFLQSATFIHYADIVNGGYNLENAYDFPLLPAAMWALTQIGIPPAVGALVVVNIAFLAGLLSFAWLGARYVGRDAAIRAAVYLAIFPLSYYFSLASTESLMLAGVGLAAVCAITGRWWLAALAAAACGLTRPPGVLVAVLLAGLAWALRPAGARLPSLPSIVAVCAAPLAMLGFFAYLQVRTGDFFAAIHAQEEFGRHMSLAGPFVAIRDAVSAFAGGALGMGFELVATVVAIAALGWFAIRAIGDRWEVWGWVAFGVASLLMPLATGLVWQMPRFTMLIPPVIWALGMLGRRQWLHQALLVLLPMALAFKLVFEIVGVTQ